MVNHQTRSPLPKTAMSWEEEAETVEINGDLLETILSHVPAVDLVSASLVSKWWRRAVSSSLRHRNPPKPWLLLHTQSTRFPHSTASYAFDPRSNVWIRIFRPPIEYISSLNSSHSNLLYMLSPSRFSFSLDPLSSNWRTVSPPRVWRTDPIVARLGNEIIVAGGVCYFEDDPLAVEIYDLESREWRTCESMPGNLKESASAWLSTAVTNEEKEKLVVTDKQSGVTHWFDSATTGTWSDSFSLNPGQQLRSYHIGSCASYWLVLVGVIRIEDAEVIKIWRIAEGDFSCEEIGEMPEEFVIGLRGDSENCLIEIRAAGNTVYVYNPAEAEEVVACELDGGRCRWSRVRNLVAREGMIAEKLVFSCSEVGIGELQRAMTMDWRFQKVE